MKMTILLQEERWQFVSLLFLNTVKSWVTVLLINYLMQLEVQKNDDIQYPRKYQDYTVTINDDEIPEYGRSEKDDLMEYSQDDYLMISGIQHFKFCRRQWALIHVEQQWAENEHTVIGELDA